MLWDGLILLAAIVLAINGWNRGLLRSWRGPIAMVIATLVVQHYYIDFSTWIMSRLRISPETAVIFGYLILWFSLEAVIEIALAMLIRGGVAKQPFFFDRVGGVVYGLAKAAVIIVLPLMATSVDLKIPPPPADKSGLKLPDESAAKGSFLVPGFSQVADAVMPLAGKWVVSYDAPSFTPSYKDPEKEKQQADAAGTEQPVEQVVNKKEIEDLLK
jgi:uncharacterized membrane protein required for colicin V production